jgi:5-methylcytosine-specific restriction protein A
MARDRYTCQVCHRRQRARTLEVDHVVEVARGGASLDYLNLQTLCRRCHSAKTRRFLATHRRMAHRPIRLATEVVAAEADGWGASWFPS